MIGLPKGLFDFQDACVNFLLDTTSNKKSKQVVTVI